MGELANRVRAKYPDAYTDLTDDALEAKVMAKYPGVYDHLVKPVAAPKPMGMGEQLGKSFMSGLKGAALGMQQVGAEVGEALGVSPATKNWFVSRGLLPPQTAQELRQEEVARRQQATTIKSARGQAPGITNPASWAEFGGEIAPTLLMPASVGEGVAAKGLARLAPALTTKAPIMAKTLPKMVGGATAGAGLGAIQPVTPEESRGTRAFETAILGGAVPAAGAALTETSAGQMLLSPVKSLKRVLPKFGAGKTVADAKAKATLRDIQEAEQLRARGIPVTIAEETKDPRLLQSQRILSKVEGEAHDLAQDTLAKQSAGIRQQVEDLKGTGSPAGLAQSVQGRSQQLTQDLESARAGLTQELDALEGAGADAPNQILRNMAMDAHTGLKQEVDKLYNAIDLETVISTPKLGEILNGIRSMAGSDFVKNMPRIKRVADRVGQAVGDRQDLPLSDFKPFREQIGELAAATKGSTQGHYFAEIFKQLQKYEDDAIAASPGLEAWKKARDFYKSVYVPAFKQGIGEDILATTRAGEQKLDTSKIMSKFFPPKYVGVKSAADSFKRIYGDSPAAKQALLDAVRADAYHYAGGDKAKMATWLTRYNEALEQYGFKNEFRTVEQAMASAERAGMAVKDFAKTELAKALKKEPNELGAFLVNNPRALREAVTMNAEGAKAAVGNELEKRLGVGSWQSLKDIRNAADKSTKFKDEVLPVLEQSGLYSTADIDAFNALHSAVRRIGQVDVAMPEIKPQNRGVWEALARLAGFAAAKITGRVGAYPLGKEGARWYDMGYHGKVNEYLRNALHDPEYAAELAKYATELDKAIKTGMKPSAIKRLIDSRKAKLGVWNLYNAARVKNPEAAAQEPESDYTSWKDQEYKP